MRQVERGPRRVDGPFDEPGTESNLGQHPPRIWQQTPRAMSRLVQRDRPLQVLAMALRADGGLALDTGPAPAAPDAEVMAPGPDGGGEILDANPSTHRSAIDGPRAKAALTDIESPPASSASVGLLRSQTMVTPPIAPYSKAASRAIAQPGRPSFGGSVVTSTTSSGSPADAAAPSSSPMPSPTSTTTSSWR